MKRVPNFKLRLPPFTLRTLFKVFSFAILLGIAGVGVAGGLFFYQLTKDLPDVQTLKEYHHSNASEVFSDEGRKIGEFTTERRYPVVFETIPKHVLDAFLAAEDSSFYTHKGIDFTSILRAVFSNLMRGRYAQGGSTITQQVARSLLLVSKKKEITRKIREVVLAFRMEKQLTKQEILNLYLSEIYLGHGAFGIGAAAQNYFNKKVGDLTIAEGALLAGLPQRPNEWNPFHNPHLAKRRQQYVLKRMVEEKFIDAKQSIEAFAEPIRLYEVEDFNLKNAPYFTEFIRQYVMNKYGSEKILSEGFKVYTTVKADYQRAGEYDLIKGLREVDRRLGWRGVQEKIDIAKLGETAEGVHDFILSRLTPIRVLSASVDDKNRKLEYDLAPFQKADSPYYGETPIKEGELYKAIVTGLTEGRPGMPARASVVIGKTAVTLPIAGTEWIKVNDRPITSFSQVLKPGDIVQVRVTKTDRKAGAAEAALEQEPEIQGALLSVDLNTGHVMTMVGGVDFEKNKFNCALQAKRQVGSTSKPLLYASALDKGFSPSSLVSDSPIVFKFEGQLDADTAGEDWRPSNYSGTFEGDIPLRLALSRSMNIPTVKLLNEVTIDYAIQYARKLGVTSVLPRDLSIALGSWSSSLDEMMRAYAIFARQGRPLALKYIKKIVDGTGKVLEEYPDLAPEAVAKTAVAAAAGSRPDVEVIPPQTAFVITDMLKAAVREGTGRPALLEKAIVAGKTGTTNDHRDAWFIGYTPQVITGVWIGYLKDKPLAPGETGGKAAAPIWKEFMEQVTKDYPKTDFAVPDDIVFAYIDRQTGLPSSQPNRVKVAFRAGTEPIGRGDNLRRIGEPGAIRSTTNAPAGEDPLPPLPEDEGKSKEPETSDFLRQGFQE